MKNTGIIRRADELGRVVLPKEIREKMDIKEKDPLEIFVDGSKIILQKFQCNCNICGNTNDLIEFKNKLLCHKCINQIKGLN